MWSWSGKVLPAKPVGLGSFAANAFTPGCHPVPLLRRPSLSPAAGCRCWLVRLPRVRRQQPLAQRPVQRRPQLRPPWQAQRQCRRQRRLPRQAWMQHRRRPQGSRQRRQQRLASRQHSRQQRPQQTHRRCRQPRRALKRQCRQRRAAAVWALCCRRCSSSRQVPRFASGSLRRWSSTGAPTHPAAGLCRSRNEWRCGCKGQGAGM